MILGQLLEKILPIQIEGVCTGGTTGTIVDSSLSGKYDDDSFKDALAFIHSTTDALAPQNQFSVVSGYVDSTGTFSVGTAFSAAVGSGDYYSIADPQYQKARVLRVVNDCLRDFGIISLVNTSLTGLADTLEYTLPVALKAFPLDRVEIGNADDGWEESGDWYVVPAAGGSTGKLVFNSQPSYDGATATNQTFRIWYRDYHPAVTAYGDYISETIPDARVIKECKLALYKDMMEKNSDMSPASLQRLAILQQDQQIAEVKHRINTPDRKISKFLNIRDM